MDHEHCAGPSRGGAAHRHGEIEDEDPARFWEERYAGAGPVWSGRVNRTLADAVEGLPPGRSLDLGCGEGGDVVWLAEHGWRATGIDISETAIARARAAAAERGIAGSRIRFVAADLAAWAEAPAAVDGADEPFDLVTASFLQSPVELPRERILRAAAGRVAPGGSLVLIAHAAPPPWAQGDHWAEDLPSPESELAALGLDARDSETDEWIVAVAEVRRREALDPDGRPASLEDSLVVVRRGR